MKGKFWQIITIVMCIALVFCVVQIDKMNSQLDQLQSNISHQMRDINNGINSIYNNVNNKLEEQVAFLSASAWHFGDADYKAQVVPVEVEITPKEYNPEKTKATLICNDKSYPMNLAGGTYYAQLKLGFFDTMKIDKVLFETDGVVRTELLGWSIVPRYDFLPIVNIDSSCTYYGNPNKATGIYAVEYVGGLNMNIANIRPEQNPNKTTVYVYIDDKLVNTETLTWDPNMQESDEYYTHGYAEYKERFEVPYGSTLEIYGAVQIDGLYHVCKLEQISVAENGNLKEPTEEWRWRGAEGDIYDSTGKLLHWYDDGSGKRVQEMR